MRRFPSSYEDPFADTFGAYDQPAQQELSGFETPSITRDNKLLGFSMPSFNYTLLDYTFRQTSMSISAQLHGMFFLAESPWATAGDQTAPPTELTCYRRNLFQITGTITMPRMLRYILTEQGEQIPVLAQELAVLATESVEGNPVKIISVPWKTPAAGTTAVEEKAEKEPPPIALDLTNGQDLDSEFVSFPIAWKRLQFRIATANNGRRRELQQHFVVRLRVMATLSTGDKVPLCEVQSGPIIVRGRSPRNFQSRKDFPISGGSAGGRRSMHLPPQLARMASSETASQQNGQERKSERSYPKQLELSQMPPQYDANGHQMSPNLYDWKVSPGQTGALTAIPPDPNFPLSALGLQYAQSSPDLLRHHHVSHPPSAPISLSLLDDETKKASMPAGGVKKAAKTSGGAVRPPSFSLNLVSSPDESADLLYEYFPLGLDDWMPPVDAVYRPHVVHHTNLPPDRKAMAVKNRSKRYFSEDQS